VALLETLTDDFSGGTLDTGKWKTTAGSGTSYTVSGGTFNINTAAGIASANTVFRLDSTALYTATESSLAAKVIPSGLAGANCDMEIVNGGGEEYWFRVKGTVLTLGGYTGTAFVLNTDITYDPVAMLWLRLRHSGGVMYWDTSPDGGAWTVQGSGACTLKAPFTARFLSAWATGTSPSAYAINIDKVNILPPYAATLLPTGINDTQALGAPDATWGQTAAPTGILDGELIEAPTLAAEAVITPDGITEAQTIGAPAVTQSYAGTIAPTGIQDSHTLGAPALTQAVAKPVQPAAINDPEAVGTPALAFSAPQPVQPAAINDPETLDPPTATLGAADPPKILRPDSIIDPGTLSPPEILGCWGSNWNYGAGTYNCGIYNGYAVPEIADPPMFGDVAEYGPPLHILGIGPWSPALDWRGVPNHGINPGPLTPVEAPTAGVAFAADSIVGVGAASSRPVMGLPPTTSKGFTLRLDDGSEARTDLSMRRGESVIIDEMDTDLWWRRKDPRTRKLEVIGRFNANNVELATSDTGVTLSAQWVDYAAILGARMVLKYLDPKALPNPITQWDKGTLVTDILAWCIPTNTGLDLSEISGSTPYPLGTITQPYEIPPEILIAEVFTNLEALSQKDWEWWIETPADVNKAPKLRFAIGQRGQDKGVTLVDAGSGPTPIASWTRNGAADNYANSLYYSGTGTGTGKDAVGGVVVRIPAQIEQYGQRDAQHGNSTVRGDKDQITASAQKKLAKLADRQPTYTITLAQGFWRGRDHIDIGDTVKLVLRMGKEVLQERYRVTEIAVTIDEQEYEHVVLTLGRPKASADPRSRQSPIMRIVRYLKNYEPSKGYLDPDDLNNDE